MGATLAPVRLATPRRPGGPRAGRALWSLIAVVLIGGGIAARLAIGGTAALPTALQDGITLATSVLIESFPFVILGIALSAVVEIWIPERVIARVLPRRPLLRRTVLSLLGIVLPVCQCGNVPLARSLVARGLSPADSVAFLLAAPILNPITIVTTYAAFGWSHGILVARIVGGFVIANLVGWVLSRRPDQAAMLTPAFAASCAVHEAAREATPRWRATIAHFARETSSLLPALVVGAAIAAAVQVGISRDVLGALGSNPLLSVLALMALAFIVSICSTVDAFFMLAFGGTFLPGAITAFLTFGAMVDIKMVALLRTTYRGRTIALIGVLVGLAALVLGLGVNVLA